LCFEQFEVLGKLNQLPYFSSYNLL